MALKTVPHDELIIPVQILGDQLDECLEKGKVLETSSVIALRNVVAESRAAIEQFFIGTSYALERVAQKLPFSEEHSAGIRRMYLPQLAKASEKMTPEQKQYLYMHQHFFLDAKEKALVEWAEQKIAVAEQILDLPSESNLWKDQHQDELRAKLRALKNRIDWIYKMRGDHSFVDLAINVFPGDVQQK